MGSVRQRKALKVKQQLQNRVGFDYEVQKLHQDGEINITLSRNRIILFGIAFVCVTIFVQIVISNYLNMHIPTRLKDREASESTFAGFARMDVESAAQLTAEECKAKSEKYLDAAAEFSGAKGEGHKGWLYLLAAYSYLHNHDKIDLDEDIFRNLVSNYLASNYVSLALDEISIVKSSSSYQYGNQATAKVIDQVEKEIKVSHPDLYKQYQERSKMIDVVRSEMAKTLKPPKILLPFSTAVASFNLIEQYDKLHKLNNEFYAAAMVLYKKVESQWKEKQPTITDRELNHKYFQAQMSILRDTGDYWTGFTELSLFNELIDTMREGAVKVLEAYGHSSQVARRKASHDIIFWASVHTGNSIHEPHMTEDSLIGGVYYVSVPEHSGNLELFDPRAKSGVCEDIIEGLTNPPFHRTVTITPKEGLLVLFPGWLVHSVKPSVGLDVNKQKYRISISVNLKGEWQDTTALHLSNYLMSNFYR
eukprot:CAMPEP_0204826914 /NCGR_PEP_ID=MMETSP1346-20131115/4512_1 /ASSEMBLY_ACC=CAM_ASM_000771 /TAXON_ID=215587 /ORGANISM="Aplanochytrium stocchinoi, Strain GSBS06" /LENGTH=476 /DNA_ID=CAMNT_0051955149 /DNA_START=148 /DNA_END=1578 /DNA_ORIENTATION=-